MGIPQNTVPHLFCFLAFFFPPLKSLLTYNFIISIYSPVQLIGVGEG